MKYEAEIELGLYYAKKNFIRADDIIYDK